MGGNTSEAQKGDQISLDHPYFKTVTLNGKPGRSQSMHIMVPVPSKEDYDKWSTALKSIQKQEGLLLPIKHNWAKSGICGSNGSAQVILTKLQTEKNGTLGLKNLRFGAQVFHDKNKKVGDIRPRNIFVNENGQIKLANMMSTPVQTTNFYKSCFQKQITFIAPQEANDIQAKRLQDSNKVSITEAFSLGLTCVDVLSLTDSKDLYQNSSKLNTNSLQQRCLNLWQSDYSQLLIMTVLSLCEVNHRERSSTFDVLSWLNPHEDEIINLSNFSIQNLHPKVELVKKKHLANINHRVSMSIQQTNNKNPLSKVSSSSIYQPFFPNNYFIQNNPYPAPRKIQGSGLGTFTFDPNYAPALAQQMHREGRATLITSNVIHDPPPKFANLSQNVLQYPNISQAPSSSKTLPSHQDLLKRIDQQIILPPQMQA